MLNNGFTRTERAGNRRNAALCEGEEGVDRSLTCGQQNVGRELLLVRSANADRPLCKHCNVLPAVFGLDYGDNVVACKLAFLNLGNSTADFVGNENFVKYSGGLLNSTEHIACRNLVAGFSDGLERPFFAVVKRGNVNAALKVCSGNLHNLVKRALNTVVNSADKSGTELNGKGSACGLNGFTRSESGGLLIYLN